MDLIKLVDSFVERPRPVDPPRLYRGFHPSGASCLIKNAMIKIHKKYENNPNVNMILQIHDELIIDVPADFNPQPIIDLMIEPDGIFTIPLKVDWSMKDRWSK